MPIVGDCSLPQAQYDWLAQNRFNESTGKYVSTGTYDGRSWYGDITWIKTGAEEFLDDYRNASQDRGRNTTMPQNQNKLFNNWQTALPNQGNAFSPSCGDCVENIFNAATTARIWTGDSTNESFAGVSQSRNDHAIELALGVKREMLFYANDQYWDASNTNRFDWDLQRIDGDPYFQMATWVEKWLRAYGRVIKLLRDTSNITQTEETQIQTFFLRMAQFFANRVENNHNAFYGSGWRSNNWNLALDVGHLSGGVFSYFDSSGTGYLETHAASTSVHNNRWWDMIAYIGAYGVYFQDTVYEDLAFDCFTAWVKLGLFADGTSQEWHRQSSGIIYGNTIGNHVVKLAFDHAVATDQGFSTQPIGKYFDYTTSEGSTALFGGWITDETDGGNKGIYLFLENYGKYFQGVNGHNPLRYMGGNPIPVNQWHGTAHTSLANLYYRDQYLQDYATYNTSSNFAPYTRTEAGAWQEESYGWPWGKSNATGLYFRDISEPSVFGQNNVLPPNTNLDYFYNIFFNN